MSLFIFRPVVWLGARYSTDNQAVQQSSFYKPFPLPILGCLFGNMRRGTRRAFVKSEGGIKKPISFKDTRKFRPLAAQQRNIILTEAKTYIAPSLLQPDNHA